MSEEKFGDWLKEIMHAGEEDGQMKEAMQSLKTRFTEKELRAFILNFWFSDVMDSIRYRIGELERRVDLILTANAIIDASRSKNEPKVDKLD